MRETLNSSAIERKLLPFLRMAAARIIFSFERDFGRPGFLSLEISSLFCL
jgi:hypothetical protein